MLIDSHCHAWRRWPYAPLVDKGKVSPDVDGLLAKMDEHGVDHSVIVSAEIGRADPGTDNSANNISVAEWVALHPSRISQLVDLDSFWQDEYHLPGAAARLGHLIDATGAIGFTHYVRGEDDGWFRSQEAILVMSEAEKRGLVASVHATPEWHESLGNLAQHFPSVPILIHHLGLLAPSRAAHGAELDRFLGILSDRPNVFVKASGFHYLADAADVHPYLTVHPVFQKMFDRLGPTRMMWGSDFPAGERFTNYPHSLDLIRQEFSDIGSSAIEQIYGQTARRVFRLEAA